MTTSHRIRLEFERRLLEHPAAYHLRRMRISLWLYLDLLTRLPAGQDTLELDPREVATDMGLPEGTVRSWLGHLRRMQYLEVRRLNGKVRVRIGRLGLPEPPAEPKPRFFTVGKLARALGEPGNERELEHALAYGDLIIRQALAATLAVPERRIRKSRTALFLYLLKQHAETHPTDSRP